MKNLFKKICAFLILVVVVVLGVFANSTYVYASTTTRTLYQGYSNGINFDELHNITRLSEPSNDAPSITILVHGQGGMRHIGVMIH